ncbi:MAG: hypothetical protein D6785_00255 [Planctomycetota bacterium]|nr:MAG: hypothetical protein D6785_00255 [Planctomycetota bacterium]
MCAKAIDIGTSFIVGAEMKGGKEEFRTIRNAFFAMEKEDFEDMMADSGAFYIEKGNQVYIIGEDALKFSMISGNTESYRRPMAKGILNPGEEDAVHVVEQIVEGILGRPSYSGEVVAATIPAKPVSEELDITFHRVVLERFLKNLGYEVKIINEALGIIFSENPSTVLEDGTTIPFTGIGISFGAGMTNLVITWRAKQIFEISVDRGGDWIDEQVARMKNLPVSKVTSLKERKLDLSLPKQTDAVMMALEIYYEELIRHGLQQFEKYLKTSNATVDVPLDIVIGGGTSQVPGFVQKFEEILETIELPFQIGKVVLAEDPLKAVASGALVAAISAEKKKTRKKEMENKKREEEKLSSSVTEAPSEE